MTLIPVGNANYVGLSGDRPTVGIVSGSRFVDVQTGEESFWDGSKYLQAPRNVFSGSSIGATSFTNSVAFASGASGIGFSGMQLIPVQMTDALYVAWISGSTVRVANTQTGVIEYSGTNVTSGLMHGIINSDAKGKFLIRRGTYRCEAFLRLDDMDVTLEGDMWTGGGGGMGRAPDTTLEKGYGQASGLLSIRNPVFAKQTLRKIVLEGGISGTDAWTGSGIGIDADNISEGKFIEDLLVFGFGTGVKLNDIVYNNIHNLNINNCTNYGLLLDDETGGTFCNTCYFYGGRMTSNGINVFMQHTIDCGFYGTILESATSGAVVTSGAAGMNFFYNCSLENNLTVSGKIIIHEMGGNNNTYQGCRFDSYQSGDYFAFKLTGTNIRNIKMIGNNFMANSSGAKGTIWITSGAGDGSLIIGNTVGTATPSKIALQNDNPSSGISLTIIGNSSGVGFP